MSPITLRAHFDGNAIQLDEPCTLPVNAQLIVTVQPVTDSRDGWESIAGESLSRAYGPDEPDYSEADLVP
jgi:hypothetical protein